MAEEPIVEQEDITPVEEPIQEPEIGDPDIELDPVALKTELDAAKAEKDLQHKRATKAEAELKKLKPLQTNSSDPKLEERLERQDLRLEGYSRDEVEFLMQNGGQKALDNKIVMAGIEAIRKEIKSKEATPSGTGKSRVFQKFTEQDLKRMPLEELEKIMPQD